MKGPKPPVHAGDAWGKAIEEWRQDESLRGSEQYDNITNCPYCDPEVAVVDLDDIDAAGRCADDYCEVERLRREEAQRGLPGSVDFAARFGVKIHTGTLPIIKRCGCGAEYDEEIWKLLAFIGNQSDPPLALEMRNCGLCKTTLAMLVDADGNYVETHPDDTPA